MIEFDAREFAAAKRLPWSILESMTYAELDALHSGHLRWCSACNYDQEFCACHVEDVDDDDPARHQCNCEHGWGGRVRALARVALPAETGERFPRAGMISAERQAEVDALIRGLLGTPMV